MKRSYKKRNTSQKQGQSSSAADASETSPGDGKVEGHSFEVDDDDYGFGGWLRSNDGVAMMRLFVIGNSIVAVTTVAWPGMQAAFRVLCEWLSGDAALD